MIDEFEELRKKLDESVEVNGLNAEQTQKLSKRYNDLVNFHYQKERQYKENSLMYKKYIESLKYLRKITKDFVEFPKIKEWNYYAKQNNLLNSESLKYISGSTWHDLRNRIYSNNKKD